MPGKRAVEGASYVTPRALYRKDISAGSETDPTSNSIPVLNTEGPPNASVGLGQSDFNQYGKDARIFIAIFLEQFNNVTLDLWFRANVTASQLNNSDSSSSSSEFGATGEWVKAATKTVTESALWTIADIPPGQYKVLVKSASGGSGSKWITLVEQHAA